MDLGGEVEGTADPSASLGMTKGRVALPLGVMAVMTAPQPCSFPPATCRMQVRLLLMNKRTAGPSTPLRSGRDDNLFVILTFPMINRCSVLPLLVAGK